ncbi:MAG: Hydrolase, haloacid dehalogenase-like family [Brevibacillus sp.]|nr:Hydrolase, haloacid dehalogenase-like family [Brevibacillus sp.]
MIRGIVFDFDGLILDTETIWYHSFLEAFKHFQLDLPLETFASFVGTHATDFDLYVREKAGTQENLVVIKRMASELHHEKIKGLDVREGVREYLAEAKALGLRIGLASSSDRAWVQGFLKQLQLLSYFEVIKTADDVARVKPDPELYVEALQALHLAAEEVVAFEDSVAGAKAAIAAGIHCVIVPNPVTEQLPFERYDLRMKSMAELSLSEVLWKIQRKLSEGSRGSF